MAGSDLAVDAVAIAGQRRATPRAMKTAFRRSGPQVLLHQQQNLMLNLRIVQQLQENSFHVLTEFCFLDFVRSPVRITHPTDCAASRQRSVRFRLDGGGRRYSSI
jgi:hypothetical protein